MKLNRRLLYWGVFLVATGGVVLAAGGSGAAGDVIEQALPLWPVVVIALGIGLLLRRTRLATAGGVLAAAMPGLMLGGLIAVGPRVVPTCGHVEPASIATQQGTFVGAAAVDLRLGCGDLSVTTAPGNGWQLQAGDGTGFRVDASADRLSVASSNHGRMFDFGRHGDTWRLALPTASPLDLSAEVDAGRGTFDLAGAQLGNVRLAVNAGDARLDLGGATVGHLSMRVNAAAGSVSLPAGQDLVADFAVNAGSLRICAPGDLALRIRGEVVLGAAHYPGLVHGGDTWESPGYATAIHHADLTVTANVASVDLNPEGGCQ